MPVNFQDIQPQIKDFGARAVERHSDLEQKRQKLMAALHQYADQQEKLAEKVRQAAASNPALHCALPTLEKLDVHLPVPPALPELTLLASDGSQIYPSRHDAVEFCLINIGLIQMSSSNSAAPTPQIHTYLLNFEELYSQDGLITEEKVDLIRDVKERQMLADLALEGPQPALTLTDGPLELHYGRKETGEYSALIDDYLESLRCLAKPGFAAAGYIDKPNSDLVARLLEIAGLAADELPLAGKRRTYFGVLDRALFAAILTQPGERSAIFSIQSLSSQKFKDDLSLHFFYLNVGRIGHPHLARVEIPAWVAHDGRLLNAVHASLVSQCAILGNRHYPYLLHRAHEVAVVTMEEKDQLENSLVHELYQNGIQPDEASQKQGMKDQVKGKGK